jgi:hypothetical protein
MAGYEQPGPGREGVDDRSPALSQRVGRRAFLKAAGAVGAASIAAPVLSQFDAYGAGIRVPAWVISPFAKKAHLETTVYEHTSTLKFFETVFGLPTLASVNHRFDQSTPGGPNNQAAGGSPAGPPAPPRDGIPEIGNLMECFTF